MKWILAAILLTMFASQAQSAVACGPRGCVAARPHGYYGQPYRGGYDRGYDRPYHRNCVWIAGARVCR